VFSVARADGAVIINTKLNTAGFSQGAANLKNQFAGLTKAAGKLGAVMATALSIRAIVNFGKEAIELGSDLQEVQNVVDVTFPELNEQLNEFARNAAKTAGLSETMAKRYAGTFGAMAKSFRFTEEEAYNMSTTLVQLTGDVASFYNLSQDAAYTKLKSVFTGETESLKDLGVVMTEAALNDFALRKGIGKTVNQMSEQEKVALRYQFVLEQLGIASGDFLRTQNSWANQTKILSLQVDQLKASLGQGLINVLTPLIQKLNELIPKLQMAADAFRDFTASLFGDAGNSNAMEDLAGSTGDLADQLEKVETAAKKALAPFDEIVKINNDAKDNSEPSVTVPSGSVSGGTVSAPTINSTPVTSETLVPGLNKAISDIMALLSPLNAIDFTNLKNSFSGLSSSFSAFAGKVSQMFSGLWEGALVPLAGWAIEDGAPKSIEYLSEWLDRLGSTAAGLDFTYLTQSLKGMDGAVSDLSDIISGGLLWAYDNVLDPLAGWAIEKAAPATVDLLTSAFGALKSALDPVIDGADGVYDSLKPLFEWMGRTAVDVLKDLSGKFDELAALYDEKGETIRGTLDNIRQIFIDLWDVASPVLDDMKRDLRTISDISFKTLKGHLSLSADYAKALTDTLASITDGDWLSAWESFKVCLQLSSEFAKANRQWLGEILKLNFENSGIVKLLEWAKDLYDWLDEIGASNWVNDILASAFAGAIGSGNSLSSGFSIPHLASGTVIPPNAPFMAVLGDQRHGTNVEAPLSTIEEAVENVLARQGGVNDSQIVAVLEDILDTIGGIQIGDDVIANAVYRYNSKMNTARGGV
jgi:hypothetical protein